MVEDENLASAKNDNNIAWHHAAITREQREKQNGHKGVIIWFTGLPCSGKSTLSHAVEERLHKMGCHTFVLDGDNVRHGLCSDLGFSSEARVENIRRIGELAKLFLEAGEVTMAAFISPFRDDRERSRNLVPHGDFLEVFCECPLEVCEKRDVKGLYKKARAGEIKDYTGVSSPYEEPKKPELVVDTDRLSLEECADKVMSLLVKRGVISSSLVK